MPNKSIPAIGDSNWGITLNSHINQLVESITGGINKFEQFSQRPTTLTADDAGKTLLYTQTGNIHQWTGTAWKVLNESVINVKDYGAVGDGVVDDTLAIQKCADLNISSAFDMNDLTSTSKNSIFLPDGIYLISGNGVLLRENMDLNFASDKTTLKYIGTSQCILINGVHRFTSK